MNLNLTFQEAVDALEDAIKAGLVPIVKGRPGSGKSAITKVVERRLNLKMIDCRVANMEPVEVGGYPDLSGEYAVYKTVEYFPTADWSLPINPETGEEYEGWLLNLEELTHACPEMQGALYRIILDRLVGQKPLHPKVHIIATGNRVEDRAAANELGSALSSRLVHLNYNGDFQGFRRHMVQEGWASQIIGFLSWKETLVNNFDPKNAGEPFACERTWDFLNNLTTKAWGGNVPETKFKIVAGTIGTAAASDFMAYCAVFKDLIPLNDILANPDTVRIPDDQSAQIALVTELAHKVCKVADESPDELQQTAEAIVKFFSRLRVPYAILGFKMMYAANEHIINIACMTNVIVKHADSWKSF